MISRSLRTQLIIGTDNSPDARHALRQLSIRSTQQLVGYIPPRTNSPLPDAYRRDPRPVCYDAITIMYLYCLKKNGGIDTIWQWIAIMETCGERLPDEHLPLFMQTLGQASRQQHGYIWKFAGRRGKWLLHQDNDHRLLSEKNLQYMNCKFHMDNTIYQQQKNRMKRILEGETTLLLDETRLNEIDCLLYYPWNETLSRLLLRFLKSFLPSDVTLFETIETLIDLLNVVHILYLEKISVIVEQILIKQKPYKAYQFNIPGLVRFRLAMHADMNPNNLPLKILDFPHE